MGGVMTRKLQWIAGMAAIASILVTSSVVANAGHAPGGVVITDMQRGTLAEGVKSEVGGILVRTEEAVDVVTAEVTFEMGGGSAGWHSHPGPVFVVVKSGTLTVWDEDCTMKTYSQGDAFFEMGPKHSMLVKNESPSEDVTLYATFIVPVGAEPLTVPERHLCDIRE
jgi:quercetin dioxygenase-like cupin family protein